MGPFLACWTYRANLAPRRVSDRRVFRGLEGNEMNLKKLGPCHLAVPPASILAADESHPSIGRRFEPLGIPNTEETAAATVRCSSPPPAWRTP